MAFRSGVGRSPDSRSYDFNQRDHPRLVSTTRGQGSRPACQRHVVEHQEDLLPNRVRSLCTQFSPREAEVKRSLQSVSIVICGPHRGCPPNLHAACPEAARVGNLRATCALRAG